MMIVFPSVIPRLDILQAAGQVILEGTASGVTVTLPVGASPNQTVTLQARDFTNAVSVTVVVTPDTGPSTTYQTVINMTNNPAQTTVNVVIPDGSTSRITAWTR